MIIERNGTTQYKKFSDLKPGDVFGIGNGVHMVINKNPSEECGGAVNLRSGAVLVVDWNTAVTPYPNATLII